MPADADRLEALKVAYEEKRRENERLRDARASVTRQLGPLPISAAIVAGLIAGFAPPAAEPHAIPLIAAGILSLFLVLFSILYNNMRPYRELRFQKEAELPTSESPSEIINRLSDPGSEPPIEEAQLSWYAAMISVEEEIYGQPRQRWYERRLPSRHVTSLQEGFDRERSGLIVVQALFALVISFLVLARVV